MRTAIIALAAVTLDWLLAEPRRWHPLCAFGRLAGRAEKRLFAASRLRGAMAAVLLVVPIVLAVRALETLPNGWGAMASVLFLYLAIGHKSLHDHALRVTAALHESRPDEARRCASHMVSRDPETLEPVPATIESVLENGADAVFATVFWFAVAGAAGAVAHRLVNTLDAMWGYRNERYEAFGWAAARLDDAMNWIPARLTALTYAIQGQTGQALRCWRTQAPQWESPNAGPVMAAGAGALGVTLGGLARYGGAWRNRPLLGAGRAPRPDDIGRALQFVRHGVIMWLGVLFIMGAACD